MKDSGIEGWVWNSNSLAIWCEELTHLKRPWCWVWLKVGEGGHRGWDGWMASPPQWTWVWVSSGSWWWTGRPGMLQSIGLRRVRHDWVTELRLIMKKKHDLTKYYLHETHIKFVCSVAKLCLTLCDPMDYSPPGYSVHGISQARILEWIAISSLRGSSQPRDWTHISCIGRWILYH